MKLRTIWLLATALVLTGSRAVAAQVFTVSSATGGTLNITTAVPGQNPTSSTVSPTTYSVTTLIVGGVSQIRARLDQNMPAGTTLQLTLAAPTGATSVPRDLTNAYQNVVTGIPAGTIRLGLTITYTLTATPAAGVIPAASRTVTLELF